MDERGEPTSEEQTTWTKYDLIPQAEPTESPERTFDPHAVAIAAATRYPGWYPGEALDGASDKASVDKLRGDLALKTVEAAKANNYQIAVVDGGSSEAFTEALRNMGVEAQVESEPGMSSGRRQVLQEASRLAGAEVLCWVEPEKVSLAQDCIEQAAGPIMRGEADIVVPKRDAAAFATYPAFQAEVEQDANERWNNLLRNEGLLQTEAEDLDAWFGPRLIRNDPEVLSTFMNKYSFDPREKLDVDKDVKPELWPDALFLPLVNALAEGKRVVSVPVPYRHPAEQTASEVDSEGMQKKRREQYNNIIMATIHRLRMIRDDGKSRLRQE
jgi:hypothetical protein